MLKRSNSIILAAVTLLGASTLAFGHGDVAPQPMDTTGLPEVGEEWLTENPYREAGTEVWQAALSIGASGYNQNCARCHGLDVISGGIAPDLRWLEAEESGDEWYIERFRHGRTQNGVTKMPAFDDLLDQKAAWAIRTYIEARPDEGAIDPFNNRLKELRDKFLKLADAGEADEAFASTYRDELTKIAGEITTGSGAPVADSIAYRASLLIDGSQTAYKEAAEVLSLGLSAVD